VKVILSHFSPFLQKIQIFFKGDVTKITPTHVTVHGYEKEIKFDYLVIATGTSYAFPAKVPYAKSTEVVQLYTELRGIIFGNQRSLCEN
jgi:NADH dehydrogenase FAD-containing subunit